MFPVVILDCVPHRFHRASKAAGDSSSHFRHIAAGYWRHAPSPPQDFFPLLVAQMRKSAAALDAVAVGGEKALDHRLHVGNLLAAVTQDAPPDQATFPPAAYRF